MELLTWLQNFLIGRHQQVILDGSTSESHAVNSGVPQGTILAPLLFLCYINDLPLSSINANIGLYADDTILYNYTVIHSTSDCLSLQNDLNSLSQWGTRSGNPDKSVFMRISCKHKFHLLNI